MSNINHFLLIHKNLVKVDHFTEEMKVQFGARVHSFDDGHVKVLSPLKSEKVSLCVYANIHKMKPVRDRDRKVRYYDYQPEGFFTGVKDFISSVSEVPRNINDALALAIGLLTKVNSYVDFTGQVISYAQLSLDFILLLNSLSDIRSKVAAFKACGLTLSTSLFFVSLFVSSYKFVNHLMSITFPSRIVPSLGELTGAFASAFTSVKAKISSFRGESAITNLMFVSILENILPSSMRKLITKMPFYTKEKLLDESNLVESTLMWIIDLPYQIAKSIGAPDSLLQMLEYVSQCIPCSKSCYYKNKLSSYLHQITENKNLVYRPEFQNEYETFFKQLNAWKAELLLDVGRLPYGFKDVYDRGCKVYKKILYSKDTTRVEPLFCVFYGPPGTGKTTLMLQLVESLKTHNSVYSHVSHGAEKDFYDQYDGEDVLMVDDIGQKGVHQWADMINMVSTAQCTLNCAMAENKDLKRFTSRLILATTNNIHLRITPIDPISDVEALYRRVTLFDFSSVSFINGEFTGDIHISRREVGVRTPTWLPILSLPAANSHRSILNFIVDEVKRKGRIVPTANMPLFEVPYIGETKFIPSRVEFSDMLSALSDFVATRSTMTWFVVAATFLIFSYFLLTKIGEPDYENIGAKYDPKTGIMTSYTGKKFYVEKPNQKEGEKPKYYSSLVKAQPEINKWRGEVDLNLFLETPTPPNNTLASISRNSVVVQMVFPDFNCFSTAMFSGRYFTVVRHNFRDMSQPFFIKVFNKNSNICYDMVKAVVVYSNDADDIAICKLDDCVPVFFRHVPLVAKSENTKGFLMTPQACLPIGNIRKSDIFSGYTTMTFENAILPHDLLYDFHGNGYCGSWYVNGDGLLIGHHVAGSSSDGTGITKVFSVNTMNRLFQLLSTKAPIIPLRENEQFGNAGAVVDLDVNIHNSKHSTLSPSLVQGIFPEERKPANMFALGKDTVKELMKPSLNVTPTPNLVAARWAQDFMRKNCIPKFSKVSMLEALEGYKDMHKLDPKTSAGFGFVGTKGDHISNGEMSTFLTNRINKFFVDVEKDNYIFDNYHKACPKDELRNLNKVDKPRIFCAAPLDIVVLQRLFFSEFLVNLHNDLKWQSGVMVGINPFSKDWEDLLSFVTLNGDNCFGGDVSAWDKSMNPVFQQMLNEIILEKYEGSDVDKLYVKMLLQLLVTTPHVNTDVAYIDTHSLASGVVLTADYNSLVNKFLSLYTFYILYYEEYGRAPTFEKYTRNVQFVAYGDDSLVGVSKDVLFYKPSNIARVYRSLGMDFTPEDKGEWTQEFRSIFNCSFLKRTFRVHPNLGIVAPLDSVSMCSTLNYIKDEFRDRELTIVKLLNFQREAFLHVSYQQYLKHVQDYLKDQCPKLNKLVQFHSEEYLLTLYNSGEFHDLLELH